MAAYSSVALIKVCVCVSHIEWPTLGHLGSTAWPPCGLAMRADQLGVKVAIADHMPYIKGVSPLLVLHYCFDHHSRTPSATLAQGPSCGAPPSSWRPQALAKGSSYCPRGPVLSPSAALPPVVPIEVLLPDI